MSTHLLQAALAHLRTAFTRAELPTLQAYGGEFSAAESLQLSYACPAVLVTVLGWWPEATPKKLGGRNVRTVRMAAFCATKHAQREARLAQAMVLADKLSLALRLWVPDDSALPLTLGTLHTEPTCENLYSRAMDVKGQALWLLTWEQEVKPRVALPDLFDLLHVEIEDTTRQGVLPAPAPTPAPPELTVTEDVRFAPLPPAAP